MHRRRAMLVPFGVLLAALACEPVPQMPARRRVTILHLADIHSHLFPERFTPSAREESLGLGTAGQAALVGGLARVATLVKGRRAREGAVFLFDTGDVFEGTPAFPALGGEPELRAFSALGVDATVLGNHDLALGEEALRSLRSRIDAVPLLGANLPEAIDSGLVAPVATVERGGVRVAAVGIGRLADEAPDVERYAAAAQQAIDRVRATTDVVVLLSHLGSDLDGSLVARTVGADLVLGGHTHDVIVPVRVAEDCAAGPVVGRRCRSRPVPVLHSGAYGRYVGVAELVVSTDPDDRAATGDSSGRSAVLDVHTELLPVREDVEEDADMTVLLAPYRRALSAAGFDRPIAFAPEHLNRKGPSGGDSALGNLVTGALLAAGQADLAFINSTGLRADVEEGEVTTDALFRVLPFEDTLVVQRVSGATLLSAIDAMAAASCARDHETQVQLSGGALAIGCHGATSELSVGAETVAREGTYTVATVSFLAESGRWLDASRADSSAAAGTPVRDVVLSAVKAFGPCLAPGTRPDLPCVGPEEGARSDGRIRFR